MNDIAPTTAADINRHHELACLRAGEAVNHAKEAGKLLLEVKAGLQHGEFVPWVEKNIVVTPRQVQRYIAAALGQPVPIRAIKNDTTVSHLEVNAPRLFPGVPDVPALFVPNSCMCYAHAIGDGKIYLVEPSSQHPGYFFISRLNSDGETYDCTRRPVAAEWVEETLKYYGLDAPSMAGWKVKESYGVLTPMETLDGVAA